MSVDLRDIRTLEPGRFEQLVAALLDLEGFENVVAFGGGGDSGFDIRAEWPNRLPSGDTLSTVWGIQCKRYSKSIGEPEIQEILRAVLLPPGDLLGGPLDYFLIVTSSGLTTNARRALNRANQDKKRQGCVCLAWDGEKVLKLVETHQAATRRFFSTPAPSPRSPEKDIPLVRLSILIDKHADELLLSFLCETEVENPVCLRVQTTLPVSAFDHLTQEIGALTSSSLNIFGPAAERQFKDIGAKIQDLIPPTLLAELHARGTCYVRLSSNSHIVPFELAWEATRCEFLGSVQRIGRIQVAEHSPKRLHLPNPSILLIGDPSLPPKFPWAGGKLPGADNEISVIKQILSDRGLSITTLSGVHVTRTNLREILSKEHFQFIHFAGHGIAPRGDVAGLIFADGIAPFEELSKGDFGGSVIFLSSCSSTSALNEASKGFFRSGAAAVIGFIARISDEAAALLSTRFYQVLESGATLGDALHRAKKHQIAQLPGDFSWAALVLYGDPTKRLFDPPVTGEA